MHRGAMFQQQITPRNGLSCLTPSFRAIANHSTSACSMAARPHASIRQRVPCLLYASAGLVTLQPEDASDHPGPPATTTGHAVPESAEDKAYSSSTVAASASRRRPNRTAAAQSSSSSSSNSASRNTSVRRGPSHMQASTWAATVADITDSSRRHADVHNAPGTSMLSSSEVQLARQFRDLMKHPLPGVSVAPDDEDLFTWHVKLAGPEGSPYEGGWFDVKLKFSGRFPGVQPTAKFATNIWHPNVGLDGRVCIALGTGWNGTADVCSVTCVLVGLQMLLATPNPGSPLNYQAGEQMVNDPEEFKKQARMWTYQHAM